MLSNVCVPQGDTLNIHKSPSYATLLISLPPKRQTMLLFDKVKLKSSMYILKRSGDSVPPYLTPLLTVKVVEVAYPYFTDIF